MTKGGVLAVAISLALAPGCCMSHRPPATTETTTISGPGFSPDPITTSGQAGGRMAASTLAPTSGCAGDIPEMPQHIVHLEAALPLLRVLVNGSDDTTLVVRTPSGQFLCNDDSGDPQNGLNPVVEISGAAPGDYAIYVGAFSEQAMLSTYAIGFTTTPGTFPSQVVR